MQKGQQKREVNTEVNTEEEEINADDIDEEEDEEDEEDEEVIPPVEEEEEEPEDEQDVDEEESDSSPDDGVHLKNVQGETPREKALRLEVTRLRREKRKELQSQSFDSKPQEQGLSQEEYDKLKEFYSDEEIQNMEKAIDVIAQKKGYVKKEQSYEQTLNSVLEDFFEDRPEYLAENDTEDIRWGTFQRILKSDYNISNKTPKQLKNIYKKVDRDVREQLGEVKPNRDEGKRNAQKQKIKSVSHSGGTKSMPNKPEVDPETRNHFKGFEDEDLVE